MRLGVLGAALALALRLSVAESNLTQVSVTKQVLQGDFQPPQVFENINLVRTINLEKGYVRENINVIVTNTDKKAQSVYYVPFENDTIGKIGGFEVRDKKAFEKGKFDVSTATLDDSLGGVARTASSTQYFVISFPEPLAPKQQLTLSISYHVLSSIVPLPASINQNDKQYLSYSFSAYVLSAYPTIKQKTKLKLPNGDIPEYTQTEGLVTTADPEKQGSSMTYGTYDTAKIPAGTVYPVTVRYEFTKPILACSLLERDVEVSHWGNNLATEERYWLRNDGATLLNQFSRVAWQTQNYYLQAGHTSSSALRELKVPLTPGSVDPYFTDDIGNVSTSRFRPSANNNPRSTALLELKPRYPVFGGWKYSFRIGWNNVLTSFLRKLKSQSNTYILAVPLLEGPKMPEGIQYEHFVFRVHLPEGSKNVKYEIHGGAGASGIPQFDVEQSLHRTFMDTLGRTELKLSALNVVDEARDVQVLVTYEYSMTSALRKPLSILVGVSAVFVVAWAASTLDTSIGRKKQ